MVFRPSGVESGVSWGFFGHRLINRNAVFHLPPELFPFFRIHIVKLVTQAVVPDQRRYIDKAEAPMHYIDLDGYDSLQLALWRTSSHYFDSLDAQTWNSHGALPNRLLTSSYVLTRAFMDGDSEKCIRVAGDLAHYIGDAHVPLHTTSNYDGQQTGQEGIHGLWESRLPEMFADQYDLTGRKARYIENLHMFFWQVIDDSHSAVDSVLSIEERLGERRKGRIKGFSERGAQVQGDYSGAYAHTFHRELSGMVERRLRAAIVHTADVWYTCWVNAGQPDVSDWVVQERSDK